VWSTECKMMTDDRKGDEIREKYGVVIVDIDTERAEWNAKNLPVDEIDMMIYIMTELYPEFFAMPKKKEE